MAAAPAAQASAAVRPGSLIPCRTDALVAAINWANVMAAEHSPSPGCATTPARRPRLPATGCRSSPRLSA
jgi:hypothetical protein